MVPLVLEEVSEIGVAPTEQVGRSDAPVGEVVNAHVTVTEPV
jgi:hypothetical protein